MKLKKVKIVGFKSFADKVQLEFHDGVTGVVGPNGCGKSNIADAFRWVMGEQSAKSLRGGKMQDVIFAGTSHRKAVGLAEVSLTFANTEGRVGIPYNEVEITRRYHRDGESDYLINGNSVRLKDIQSILMDVGIGKNAYAIFEQGKIDQIIQLGPEERRTIFEEAAGILKFLVNKRDTERKLTEIELNASRLKDIHDEVQKEISHLSGQASRAKEYNHLKKRLESLLEECLALKITALQQKQMGHKDSEQKSSLVLKEMEGKLSAILGDLSAKKEALEKESLQFKEKEREQYLTKSTLEVALKELETVRERLQENKKQTASLFKEKDRLIQERDARKQDMEKRIAAKSQLSGQLEDHKLIVEQARAQFSDCEKLLSQCRQKVEKTQEKVLTLTRSSGSYLSEWKQKKVRYESLREKITACEKAIGEFAVKREKLVSEESEKREILEKVSKEVDVGRAHFQRLDIEIKQLVQDLDEVSRLFEILSKDLVEMKAREKALVRLQEDLEGVSSGTKILLKESKKSGSPLHGKLRGLWEYFDIQAGFEEAIASVLKPYSDTLVVENKDDFKSVLEWADKNKVTEFSLVCIDPEKTSALAEDKQTDANSLIKKVKINAAAAHFLGGKAVVQNLESALDLIQKKIGVELFSMDGYFVDHSGTFFRSSKKGGSLFLRDAEIKSLAEKIKGVDADYQTYKGRLDKLREERLIKSEERSSVDKRVRSLEMQLVEKNFAVQKVVQEQQSLTAQSKERDLEKIKAAEEVDGVEKDLIKLQAKGESEELKLKEEEDRKNELSKQLEELLKSHRSAKDALKNEEGKFEKGADEARKVSHTLNLLEVKDHESGAQEQRLSDQIKNLEALLLQLTEKEKELSEKSSDNKAIYEEQAKETQKLDLLAKQNKEALKTTEQKVVEEENKLKKERDRLQKVELDLALVSQEKETLLKDFKEKWPEKEFKECKGDISKAEKEMKQVKVSLEGYTDVNLAAAATLDQHKGRAGHLQKEMNDLASSCDELNTIITKLSDESRELFKATLEAVRINFKKNFQILFNGGEADLELTNSDDILKAGVEIVAKPPGKQMRSINLLSGGEKCLTAMALLFSIFEVKAAPFCILDEIDAPLDDSNVERFCNMVKHFADRCQFIIITHNKRTMAIADRLYGVSMEEKGVSKMLMMEFQQSETEAKALVTAN